MGGLMSKKPTETSSSMTELISYNCEATCRLDYIDTTLNQEVVKCILERNKDVWKNREVLELIKNYFQNRSQTLHSCPALDKFLKHAHYSRSLILEALKQFEEEIKVDGSKYVRTLETLKNLKVADDPFTEEFFQIFQSVCEQQILMFEELQQRKNKLKKKIKDIHFWRQVSRVIFAAIFAAVLICSVVAVTMASPPVAAALSAATCIIPLGGKWIDSLFKNYEHALKRPEEVISSMQVGTCVAKTYLGKIWVLIDKLKTDIKAVIKNVDSEIEEEAVKSAIEEMKKKQQVFMENVKDLEVQADMCNRDIRRPGIEVLESIIKPPNN